MFVRHFAELDLGDVALAGGKAASLGELDRLGVRVPPGFAVTTNAYRAAVGNGVGLDRSTVDAAPLPDGLRAAVLAAYAGLGADAPVAVRSSATAEDSADASFAGLQDTYLWVRGAESVLAHMRQCWASLYSVESVTYRRRQGIPEDGLAMGVVVQRMVDARCAGVMFTRSPLTGDRSVVAVEATWGLGSALVGGDVTPDRYMVNKVTGEITRTVATKERRHRMDPSGTGVLDEPVPEDLRDAPCLTEAEVRALVALARRIEEHYGTPQDIEWAIDDDGICVLQSRPETVWAKRDAAPLAAPRARAFDHVFDLLGRRGRAD